MGSNVQDTLHHYHWRIIFKMLVCSRSLLLSFSANFGNNKCFVHLCTIQYLDLHPIQHLFLNISVVSFLGCKNFLAWPSWQCWIYRWCASLYCLPWSSTIGCMQWCCDRTLVLNYIHFLQFLQLFVDFLIRTDFQISKCYLLHFLFDNRALVLYNIYLILELWHWKLMIVLMARMGSIFYDQRGSHLVAILSGHFHQYMVFNQKHLFLLEDNRCNHKLSFPIELIGCSITSQHLSLHTHHTLKYWIDEWAQIHGKPL